MNYDPSDVTRFGEPHVGPGSTGVRRLEDALAPVVTRIESGPGAQPDDVRIRRRDGDVAHGHHRVDSVEHRRSRRAVISALEYATVLGKDIDLVGPARDSADVDIDDASAEDGRPDATPSQRGELVR